jgi:predicted XRE-type DNA-binding protein
MRRKRAVQVEAGSGNVFADLGLPDAVDMLLKSRIVVVLNRRIKERKLTQTAAAKLIGIGQPDLSNLLHGRIRGYSTERLMRMLTAFGQDVGITVQLADDIRASLREALDHARGKRTKVIVHRVSPRTTVRPSRKRRILSPR